MGVWRIEQWFQLISGKPRCAGFRQLFRHDLLAGPDEKGAVTNQRHRKSPSTGVAHTGAFMAMTYARVAPAGCLQVTGLSLFPNRKPSLIGLRYSLRWPSRFSL